jgi:predicted nucleic acid-binding protein
MAVYFFDTSALAKRYAPEVGTQWVKGLTDPAAGHIIYIARITGAEILSAIWRKVSGNHLTPAEGAKVAAGFRSDFATLYQIIEVTDAVVARAMTLIETYRLKGYDGVQLAAALEINDELVAIGMPVMGVPALTLISSDQELNTAAAGAGLVVDDPNNHP